MLFALISAVLSIICWGAKSKICGTLGAVSSVVGAYWIYVNRRLTGSLSAAINFLKKAWTLRDSLSSADLGTVRDTYMRLILSGCLLILTIVDIIVVIKLARAKKKNSREE